MRKIVTGLFMSLDGVVEAPSAWAGPYFNDELSEMMTAGIAKADAILLGRRTYLQFAGLWRDQDRSIPMARFLNDTPKYVVSSTLRDLDWGPASLVRGDLAGALAELKEQPGGNIQVPGSPTLVSWLLRAGLLDELSLLIAPIVLGSGLRLFDEITERMPLALSESVTLRTGAVSVTYRPASS
jgi:dihydrofolate reductase